ncbi:MAG: CDP-glycerol glycerophosphotransferase family protein [Candidatus Nanopelagicales bacterium]
MTRTRAAARYSPARVRSALDRRRLELERSVRLRRAQGQSLRDVVLFESFAGKMIGDNPLGIQRELVDRGTALEILWTVSRPDLPAPAGTRGVLHGSAQWLEALATSRYLVNNTNFPRFFRKAPGQVYCQTWHGTPLKRLAHDMAPGTINDDFLALYDREAAAWDYLVAANEFSVATLGGAFGYRGTILPVGYPRNDRLVTASDEERQAIREGLGVPDPDERLLLYGPTWRTGRRTAAGQFAPVNYLDPSNRLPEGWRLAFRGHSHTHGAHDASIAGGALDVTRYPDVTDLLIAADALLTDYSSLMFDFAVTGRPILFLTPDLADYRESRGFYLDFEAQAPGPILATSAEVVARLADLPGLVTEFGARYADWQARFTTWEDGHASRRVVDAVFGSGSGLASAPPPPRR